MTESLMSVASDSSSGGVEDSGPEEIPLKEELSIHVALAGITLSHESIPILGAENPMNGVANVGALIVILGVVLAYLSKRFDTRDSALKIIRTLSPVIFLYLIVNLVNGTSLYLKTSYTPFQSGYLIMILSLGLTGLVIWGLGVDGIINIWKKGKRMENRERWSLPKRFALILAKFTIVSGVIVYVNITVEGYRWASFFGVFCAAILIFAFSMIYFREENVSIDSGGKADTMSFFLLSTATCATILVGPEWTELVI